MNTKIILNEGEMPKQVAQAYRAFRSRRLLF